VIQDSFHPSLKGDIPGNIVPPVGYVASWLVRMNRQSLLSLRAENALTSLR